MVWEIIYLAVGCGVLGVFLTFVMLFVSQYFQIDIFRHWWLLAVPMVVSVTVNVILLETFRRYRRKRQG
ncbi:MAG: hypothetical protein ABID87_00965 [Chloroflexota bacterium]